MASDGSIEQLVCWCRTRLVFRSCRFQRFPTFVCVIKSELPRTLIYYTHTRLRQEAMLRASRGKRRRHTSAFKIGIYLLVVRVGPVPHLSSHLSWNNSQLLRVFLPMKYLVSGLCHHREIFCGPIWNADDLKQGFS